jgi:DNA invertase Pin-like site-specific DNA recombinase
VWLVYFQGGNTMSNEIRAVAYARVSSKEQADKELSIPAQLEAIRNYCKQKGWKLITEYIDAGKSAKTDERPEFQKMIAMAKRQNRNFDVIIVHKVDRFSRNRDDHVIYKSLLKKLGVSVYSVTEQTDPETPHGFLLEGIMEVISEFYNMNLKTETMKGMRENAKRGFHNGGIAPYAYKLSKVTESTGNTKTILVPGDEKEVATVKRIFHMYVYEGYGYKKIASILNEEGIPSATGILWSYSSVHDVLHNEVYIGNKIWNMHDYSTGKKKKPEDQWIRQENTHTALVSQEVFNLVKAKSKTRIKNSSVFEATNSPFILRGLFKCPYCGTNMVGGQSGGRGSTRNIRRYYVCGLYQRKGKAACKFKSYNKEKIESLIINAILKEFTYLNISKVLNEELIKFAQEQNKESIYRLNNVTKEIELTRDRIKMLSNDLKVTNNKQIAEYITDLKKQLDELEQERKELQSISISDDTSETSVDIVRSKIRDFINRIFSETPEQQNILLKEFVDSIQYNSINNMITTSIVIKSPENSSNIIFKKNIYVSF